MLDIHSTCRPPRPGLGWSIREVQGAARAHSSAVGGFPDDVDGAHRPQVTDSFQGHHDALRAAQTWQLPGEVQTCRHSAHVGEEFHQRGKARCHVQGAPATSLCCVCTMAESLPSLRVLLLESLPFVFSSKIQAALPSLETSAQPSGQLLKGWPHRAGRGADSRVWAGSFSCWETLKLAGSHGALGVTRQPLP